MFISACATPYKESGMMGGYGEKELEPGIWRITYGGNGYTTRETVQTYWLYRAATFTLEKGYDGFEIISPINLAALFKSSAPRRIAKGGGGFFIMSVEGGSFPAAQADIRLLKKPFVPHPPKIFDAAALKAATEKWVKGDKCGAEQNVCPHVHRYLMASPPP
jgi:hypothetical protein